MKILGIDYGDVRTGLATCDPMEIIASAYDVINEKDMGTLTNKIVKIIEKEKITKVILGFPKNMNNTQGPRCEKTLLFKEMLEKKCSHINDFEIILCDERCTTISAHNIMHNTKTKTKDKKNSVDKIAAAIILQSYLDSK